MPYTTPTDVRVALTPGGDGTDAGSAASLTDADLQAAIADATDEVNVKLSGRYATPFSLVPDLVKTLTTTIAGYLATLTAYGSDPIESGNTVALRYVRAEQILAQLQSGAAVLDGAASASAADVLLPVWPDPASTTLYDGDNGLIDYPPVAGGPRFLPIP